MMQNRTFRVYCSITESHSLICHSQDHISLVQYDQLDLILGAKVDE